MVRWQSERRSGNVEDRRFSGGGSAVRLGGGGSILMLVLVFFLTGGDLGKVLQFFVANQVAQGPRQPANVERSAEDDRNAAFAAAILGSTEDVWTKLFAENGLRYQPTPMVLYRDRVASGCGNATSASGPFYCPADRKVYLDLSFYEDLSRRFGAPGDFAQAYVIAHEVGHHVQNLMGTMDARSKFRGMSENEFSVRLELQADFYAGVWGHHANKTRKILEPGDIEEGLRAAAAIGDDAIQKRTQGRVVKESFTHGSSAQRVKWFKKGLETGDLSLGDTFSIANP